MSLILSGTDGVSDIDGTAATPAIRGTDANTGIFFPAADTIAFAEGGAEAMRINSSGNMLIGTTSSVAIGVVNPKLQVEYTDYDASSVIKRNQNDTGGPTGHFIKSRGTTNGSNTVVQSGDTLGQFRFWGTDGTDPAEGASITAQVDGTPGNNDMPGRLIFSTTADGSDSPTERMRIDSSGNVGIGTSSPLSASNYVFVTVQGGSSGGGYILYNSSGSRIGQFTQDSTTAYLGNYSNNPLVFQTNNTERARITADGNFQTTGTATRTGYGIYDASGSIATFANGATSTITLPTPITSGIFCLFLEDQTNGNKNTRQIFFASNRYGSSPQITSLGSHNGSTAGVSYSVSTSSSSNLQTITITNSQGQNMGGSWAYTGLAN